jgi:peptide deformylase
MSIIHVNHIESNCRSRFGSLIDVSDVHTVDPSERDVHFLTRALAAFAVSALAKADDVAGAKSVVDESHDDGIDAFYFDSSNHVCYLVQSKWDKAGTGTIDVASVLKFVQGVNDFFESASSLGPKMQARNPEIQGVLGDSRATFVLVIAYTGKQGLSAEARKPLDLLLAKLNEDDPWVSLEVLKQKELHDVVEQLALGDSVDLTILLHEWGRVNDPYKCWYGQVDVSDIVPWGKFGNHLYHKNIRAFKGNTDVNDAIVGTLRDRPENFLYFNNGIILLCSDIDKQPLGGSSRSSGVFECKGASVVNGAQTVGSIIGGSGQTGNARVMVRLISLENCPPDFANEVTRATNTQNRVDKRDFAALDKEQLRLKSDMLLTLGKEYVYRTGDAEPSADSGCTLDEAAVGLACAQTDINFAMVAKREVGRLYEDITQPPYVVLFNPSISATRLWRTVEVMRSVDEYLKKAQTVLDGKPKLIAIHGNRFILHLVFRRLKSILDESVADVSALLSQVSEVTKETLAAVVGQGLELYPNAYPSNLFKNSTKCKAIVEAIDKLPPLQQQEMF